MPNMDKTLENLEQERKEQEQKALEEFKKQSDMLEKQRADLMNDISQTTGEKAPEENLSLDELQALGDTLAGKEVVTNELNLEEQKKAAKLKVEEVDEKVKKTTELTLDQVRKQMEDAFAKQVEAIQKQAKEKEEGYNAKLEEIKLNQMSEKEKEEYKEIQRMQADAEKMNNMVGLVEQLKKERADQSQKLFEMKKQAKDIAFIRSSLQEEPWMRDVVKSLGISTEEEYKRFARISGNVKKWKELEEYDKSKGNKNVFGEFIGGQMSAQTKEKADEIGAEMETLLASVIRK